MPDDLRALLAAIVADPADDTARLVYADCLQEHGNTPRADFIRLQIEAERLHPDSNARARLEDQARALFAEHWIDWWAEACVAIGFPKPAARSEGRLGRLARRIGITSPPGHPYASTSYYTVRYHDRRYWGNRTRGWSQASFRRGFPDSLMVSLTDLNPAQPFLPRWSASAPIADLRVIASYTEAWIDGPHLASVRSLTLDDYDPVALAGVLNSPHLAGLEQLTLDGPEYGGPFDVMFTNELARAVASPRMRQLKRLCIPLWSDRAAEVVATAENLSGLQALEMGLYPAVLDAETLLTSDDIDATTRRLARLARSPHLAGLRELRLVGELNDRAMEAVMRDPAWTGLRKLDLAVNLPSGGFDPLTGPDDLPELEELRLAGVSYSVGQIAAFARSPLLKRLRHFAVRGGPDRSVDVDIADAVDPDRIETFAIGEKELQTGVAAQLEKRLGDRFRPIS